MIVPALADGLIHDPTAEAAVGFACDGPAAMAAGSLQRWTYRFTARSTLPPRARIAVAHRWPSDWGAPQSSDPSAPNYLAVDADRLAVRWWPARLHTWHPFDHVLFVELVDGLAVGRSVELRYGDASGGCPGWHAQSFIEEACPFSLRWQASDGGPWFEFARHTVRIVGAEPHRIVVTAPSRVIAGEPFDLHIRAEDRWGNPAVLNQRIAVEGGGIAIEVDVPECGFARVRASIGRPGVQRLDARTLGSPTFATTSAPVEVVDVAASTPRIFWGDLHGQSVIGCGARSIDAYYAHARDFAGVDVASHQANCFLVTNAEWQETQASTARSQRPGRFVTLLGVEWSGATNVGGDHNLYFPGDVAPLRRCSHEFIRDRSDVDTDLRHVEDMYRHYHGSETLVAVHVGGRTADLAWHDATLDRMLEVHSTHATSEWFLFDALRRGYRMAVVAGSDGVDGRPGNSHPGHMGVRNLRGGLTAILADALTRESIWRALEQRRCYATTGERILLDFSAGAWRMGDVVAHAGPLPPFEVRVEGTAPIERVDFFRGVECLRCVDRFVEAGEASARVRVAWRGASAQGNWQRARMSWDGELRIAGARILDVQGYAFDTPDEGISGYDAARVEWRSVTAGDWDGVTLALDRPEAAELTFVSQPMTLRARLGEVDVAGRQFDARNPERCVEIRRLPRTMPSASFHGTFVDPSPLAGAQAYWVRVRQADGAYAWSTPIFVDRTA